VKKRKQKLKELRVNINIFKYIELLRKAKNSLDKITEKNMCIEEAIFIRDEDACRQYKILKE
jgi:hypothetical protein